MQDIWDAIDTAKIGNLPVSALLHAILIFLVSALAIKIILTITNRALGKSKFNKSVQKFILSSAKVLLWVIAIIVIADNLGISTTSLVTVLGIVGLAFSLAVQDIMSNLFSGVTLLATKPFKTGDYIELDSIGGTVKSIGLFHTLLRSGDNKHIYVPNKDVVSTKIVNSSREPLRRVDIGFNASYDSRPAQISSALEELASQDSRILRNPEPPFSGILEHQAGSMKYTLRVWVKGTDYWPVYFSLNEKLLETLEKHGVKMDINHMNIRVLDK